LLRSRTFTVDVASAGPAHPLPDTPTLTVVIPTLNEAANLPHLFTRMPSNVFEVIVVDGASTDGTPEVAQQLWPAVRVLQQPRRGKGDALAVGCGEARGEVIATVDGDGSADPRELSRFLQALSDGAHFAKGSRFLPGGGSTDITPLRWLGNRALCALANALFQTRFTDLCYGYNMFFRECLPFLGSDWSGFEVEAQINIRAAKAGLRIVEVPSFEAPRLNGASNLRPVRDGHRVLQSILRESRVKDALTSRRR
jgi:glycosyltransferase involved in cell wall biosynthesis